MKTRIWAFAAAFLLISSIAIGGYDEVKKGKAKSKEDLYSQIELFANAVSLVRSDYVDEVDSKKLVYGAMKGMLSSLDDFSQFMEPDEYSEIQLETKGEFGGVGIEISLKDGIITVIAPIADTPAEKAGIKPGDKIVKINGEITKEMTLADAVKKMRGEPKSLVTLTVWREKEEKILDIPIKRDVIKIRSIKDARLIEDKIGYIKVVEFQEHTPGDLEDALKKLEKDGMESLILDLRNNPGGLLDVAVDVSEKFIPKDRAIVSIKSRNLSGNAVFNSKGASTHPDYPLVVLVNSGSASASEIVAGAVQDNKRGIILGTKTFGKASVQTVIPLRDGSALRITTALYYTPAGRMIRDRGIVPDIIAEREDLAGKKAEKTDIFERLGEKLQGEKSSDGKDEAAKKERDNQIERAVDLLKAMKVSRCGK